MFHTSISVAWKNFIKHQLQQIMCNNVTEEQNFSKNMF
jgi:hypothetical protein